MKQMKNSVIYKAFKELFYSSKSMFIISYTLTLLQGLSRILPIVAIQQLFDHLYLLSEENGIRRIIVYVLMFMGSRCICHIIDLFTNYLYESYNLIAGHGMNQQVNQKIYDVDAIQFEKPDFLDTITKSYRGTKSIRKFIDTWMMVLLLYVPEILVIVFYLYRANHFLPLILLLIVIPTVIVLRIQEKEYALQEEGISVIQRKKEVFEEHAFDLKSNMESRILGYLPLLQKKIFGCINDIAHLDRDYQKKKNKLENIEKLTILAGHISIFGCLLYCTITGLISIGVFSALITTLDELFLLIEMVVSIIAEGASEELEKIRNYFKITFSGEPDAASKAVISHIEKIEFRNVSFSYPEREKKALEQVSFVVKKGENLAIVGKNGSGKSTLLKLLSGIYECDEGEILINDINIKEIERKSLYHLFSAVFQNYGRYALNIRDNICLNQDADELRMKSVKNLKGIDEINNIEEDVILSREFGGIDLSGGQWQRIAIARSQYRSGEVYLLDEPTSAIDPNEEKVIYDLFQQLMKDKTSFIVTHRMGATKLADRIIVLNDGRVSGDGCHGELMEQCPDYQQLWTSQAQIYEG